MSVRERNPRGRRDDYYERDRHDYRNRSPRRDRERREDRHESNFKSRENRNEQFGEQAAPNKSIMLRGLNPGTAETQIQSFAAPYGDIETIKVVRDHRTGASKGMAFIDFTYLEDAKEFIRRNQDSENPQRGKITLDGTSVEVRYSLPKKENWICKFCTCSNYPRRTECFSCNRPKNQPMTDQSLPSSNKKRCATLSVFGLSPLTPKPAIIEFFQKFHPVKSCKLLWDKEKNLSKGTAFVEFHNEEEAANARLGAKGGVLDGVSVNVNFANYNISDSNIDEFTARQTANTGYYPNAVQNYGNTVMQLANAQAHAGEKAPKGSLGVYDECDYIYDATMFGYFNPNTNFYFDSTSGYFYETSTGQYYYYDINSHSYVPYNHTEPTTTGSDEKKDSVDDATQTAVAIIEQAQQQSTQSTETPAQTAVSLQFDIPTKSSKIKHTKVLKDINKWHAKAKELQGKEQKQTITSETTRGHKPPKEEKIQILNKVVRPIGMAQEPEEENALSLEQIIEQLKSKYEKESGSICYLCKRNLSTTEKLKLHFKLSTLHATNLTDEARKLAAQSVSDEPPTKKQRVK